MFFLIRVAFWLSLVILLIPADAAPEGTTTTGRQVSTFEAVGAAASTYQDLKGFCGRNPEACDTGRAALDTFSAKARTGLRWVYRQLDGDADLAPPERTVTGSTPAVAPEAAAAPVAPAPLPHTIESRLPQPRPLG